jgi:hypothetical protein
MPAELSQDHLSGPGSAARATHKSDTPARVSSIRTNFVTTSLTALPLFAGS